MVAFLRTRRIAEVVAQIRQHRRDDGRIDWPGGVVVEIDRDTHGACLLLVVLIGYNLTVKWPCGVATMALEVEATYVNGVLKPDEAIAF